jgi:hypothetical protein
MIWISLFYHCDGQNLDRDMKSACFELLCHLQGVPLAREHLNAHGAEEWAQYCHQEETRGSETAEIKVPKHESGES